MGNDIFAIIFELIKVQYEKNRRTDLLTISAEGNIRTSLKKKKKNLIGNIIITRGVYW